ncbi:hypothetical protein EG329_012883 [Mollisiaceae sp. DMI_Dod_QoI]|nr:hypothetical protein EG329_012883 [Helotiales sp. DMI_Dod_QoI]
MPVIGIQIVLGGVLLLIWIISLYGIIVGIWWIRLETYFTRRGAEGGLLRGNKRLAAVALTGHLCDVTMGMVILPISRHSALASFFKLSVATTLRFHMITAYTLFALVITHGLLYLSWLPVFEALPSTLRIVYPVLNPTYLHRECWPGNHSSLGIWRASLIFTGMMTAFIMLLIFITTLPIVRLRHFNLFYFTHLLSIAAIIIICLHASTMLYCTVPGLAMWALDWAMRLYELRAPLDGQIKDLGKGWFCIWVPLPRQRLHGCACTSPLAHFYIHHSDSSVRELHPFTTTTHLASLNAVTDPTREDIDIKFLFRKRGAARTTSKPETTPSFISTMIRCLACRKTNPQWTSKLAGFAEKHNINAPTSLTPRNDSFSAAGINVKGLPISIRLEGPYFTPADPYRYKTVVCFVAGTGISGALAIAGAFNELKRQSGSDQGSSANCSMQTRPGIGTEGEGKPAVVTYDRESSWRRCIIIWSVREEHCIDLPELKGTSTSSLDVRLHVTGGGRARLSVGDALDQILDEDVADSSASGSASTWVYISGPNAFIAAGETACKERQEKGVDWHGARWDT